MKRILLLGAMFVWVWWAKPFGSDYKYGPFPTSSACYQWLSAMHSAGYCELGDL